MRPGNLAQTVRETLRRVRKTAWTLCPRPRTPYNAAMLAPFLKMHGCGNDFVVFDERRPRSA